MHLAVVATSTYERNQQLTELPSSAANHARVTELLRRSDFGFRVDDVAADRELPEALERKLSFLDEPLETLLIYFSGYVASKPGRGAALLLDGDRLRAVPFARMFRTLESAAHNTLVILDVVTVVEAGQAPASIADEIADAMPLAGRVSCLLAAREADPAGASGPSSFTDLVALTSEWVAANVSPEASTASLLFESMQAERAAFARSGPVLFRVGLSEFPLRPAAARSGVFRKGEASAPRAAPPPVSWPPPSVAPPPTEAPTVSKLVEDARGASAAGDVDGAVAVFDRALLFCDPDDPTERVSVLVAMAEVLLEAGRTDAAWDRLYEILELDPSNERAVELASDVLRAASDWPSIEHVQRFPLASGATDERRCRGLWTIARMWLDEAGDPGNGIRVLEELLELQPDHVGALERMIGALGRLGLTAAAVDTRCQLAELLPEPKRRAALYAEAARACVTELGDLDRASRIAIDSWSSDSSARAAFDLVVAAFTRSDRWADLASLYEAVLRRSPDGPAAGDLCERLGEIYADALGDPDRALRAFERAAGLDSENIALRFDLADLYQERGLTRKAIEHLRAAVAGRPTEPEGYRRLLRSLERLGESDGVWNAANALVALGAADDGEQGLADAGRGDGLLDVERGLSDEDWDGSGLRADADPEVSEIFSIVADAAIGARAEAIAKSKDAFVPDPTLRHDVEKSTATMVKSLVWTSQLLGAPVPELYIYPKVKGSMLTLPVAEPTTLAAKTLGSGLDLAELSFLWGRHLAFFRREHRLMVYYSTVRELAGLMLAALTLGKSEKPDLGTLDKSTRKLAKELAKALGESDLERLRDAVRGFSKRGVSERVLGWARAVELTAGRAGLLACGDATLAVDLTRRYPFGGLVDEREQIGDMLRWSVSEEYLALRDRVGAASSLVEIATG